MLHGGNKQFVFISHPAIVDGENYNVKIKIKKTPVENKFYIHNMNLQNKNETVSLNTKDKKSRGYISYDLSRTDNIANNISNVNNETKFSLDVDEFDERNYNVINTTGLRGYASLKHEIMTWDNIKHLNQVRCISIDDRFYLYKMLDNETKDIIIYKAKKRTRSEYNAIRRAYGRGFNGNTVSIS